MVAAVTETVSLPPAAAMARFSTWLSVIVEPPLDTVAPASWIASTPAVPKIATESLPPAPLIEPPSAPPATVNVSTCVPPIRFSMPANEPTPVTLPPFTAVTVHVFVTLLAVSVSLPPDPLIEPLIVPPPTNTNESVFVPPTRFSIFANAPTPVTLPPPTAVIVHVFAKLLPVSVSLPPDPLIEPLIVPPPSTNASLSIPPIRFSRPPNWTRPFNVPEPAPVTLQLFDRSGPMSESPDVESPPPSTVPVPVQPLTSNLLSPANPVRTARSRPVNTSVPRPARLMLVSVKFTSAVSVIVSGPGPPSSTSLPPRPLITSGPFSPKIRSLPSPPVKVSAPLPP